MSVAARPLFAFEHTFQRELEGLYEPWHGAPVERPVLIALSGGVAAQLGLDTDELLNPDAVAALAGSTIPEGAEPVAMAYAGHQFGGYSPRLGDGRALLLGEIVDAHGIRQDLHLKGSGRTPFARGGDGKAAVGPMLREFAISEAMYALGVPTTRALAVVATNEPVSREVMLPGAVLARVAASHLRVGTFEYAARRDPQLLRRLADYAIARHYPRAADAEEPYLEFLAAVARGQAELIARWMLVGFVHGVMNTDNMAISGQTIDYGPCAFMDAYDAATVFSSIDAQGRYAYGNQPAIAQWNLARLAETLLPLIGDGGEEAADRATEVLGDFADRYRHLHVAGMATKLGLRAEGADLADVELLVDELLVVLQAEQPDYTSFFRALSRSLAAPAEALSEAALPRSEAFASWDHHWRELVDRQHADRSSAAAAMDRVNPVYIPRNHLVEAALDAATGGDLRPFREMVAVLQQPFDERAGLESWAGPAPEPDPAYRTFCGT
jgi:serine/tyrosine/threonine adenylyltransferase